MSVQLGSKFERYPFHSYGCRSLQNFTRSIFREKCSRKFHSFCYATVSSFTSLIYFPWRQEFLTLRNAFHRLLVRLKRIDRWHSSCVSRLVRGSLCRCTMVRPHPLDVVFVMQERWENVKPVNWQPKRIVWCIDRESNPGRPRGRRAFYHWTIDACDNCRMLSSKSHLFHKFLSILLILLLFHGYKVISPFILQSHSWFRCCILQWPTPKRDKTAR